MKYYRFLLFCVSTLLLSGVMSADDHNTTKLPSANVKSLKGEIVNTTTFSNGDKPIIISFWATWCKPCVQELNAINDVYKEWHEKTGVKLIAISIDDARNSAKVAPFANGRGWDYEVFLDENGDFKRVMNVNSVPHTFLLNGKGEIVWQHNSYAPGDENHLYELVKKVATGEKLD